MSWYNNTENNFIDATQTFEGGVGGSSGGNIVINNGDPNIILRTNEI